MLGRCASASSRRSLIYWIVLPAHAEKYGSSIVPPISVPAKVTLSATLVSTSVVFAMQWLSRGV